MAIQSGGKGPFQIGGGLGPPPLRVNVPIMIPVEGLEAPAGVDVSGSYIATVASRNDSVQGQEVKSSAVLEIVQLTVGNAPVTFRDIARATEAAMANPGGMFTDVSPT